MPVPTRVTRWVLAALLLPAALQGQGLDPTVLGGPPVDVWPTYNGDYTGQRYSPLEQINQANVKNLTLAWIYRANTSTQGAIVGGDGPDVPPLSSGGMFTTTSFGFSIKSTPLMVDGVLYFAAPDHAWAVDARTGREIWHYFWRTKGGIHIGNRGMGMYGDWLYFLTPDNYFISLDAATGEERWAIEIAEVRREYFSTAAPIVIGNHVIIGVGGDSLDLPGYLESRDPETGELQWRWYTTPRPGEPGSETWPDEYSMAHGGGMPWLTGTYDPELNLYYLGTGNANPVLSGKSREGDNLWTCSIVALNPETGELVWYFQPTRHDTHDWDAAQTPILIDGEFEGRPRRMLAQANRNGYYFLLDRETGEHLVTAPFSETMNWSLGVDENGQPIPNPAKEATVDGVLIGPTTNGATNWPPPSFNPATGLVYVGMSEAFSILYLTDTDPRPQGWAAAERGVGSFPSKLIAIDYKTGEVRWTHPFPGGGAGPMGLLSTAGGLLFGHDGSGNFVAYDPETGRSLWRAGLGVNASNGPQTFLLDGRQYIVVGAGDALYAFTLSE